MRKSQIKELYVKYLRPKCSLTLYYQRIKRWVDPIEALKPPEKKEFAVRSKLYWEQLERYKKQPQPKPPRERFYWRIQKWRTKEEAIKIQPRFHERKPKPPKDIYIKTYTVEAQKFKQDYREIRITYPTEEADVFKAEYMRLIDDLENERRLCEDTIEANEIRKRLSKLESEFAIFSSYNS